MSKQENIEELVNILEKMIDKRYEYLREREYENYIFCSRINKEYKDIIEQLVDSIKKF